MKSELVTSSCLASFEPAKPSAAGTCGEQEIRAASQRLAPSDSVLTGWAFPLTKLPGADIAVCKSLESQMMALAHQPVPLGMFTGPGKMNFYLACSNRCVGLSTMTAHDRIYTEF